MVMVMVMVMVMMVMMYNPATLTEGSTKVMLVQCMWVELLMLIIRCMLKQLGGQVQYQLTDDDDCRLGAWLKRSCSAVGWWPARWTSLGRCGGNFWQREFLETFSSPDTTRLSTSPPRHLQRARWDFFTFFVPECEHCALLCLGFLVFGIKIFTWCILCIWVSEYLYS